MVALLLLAASVAADPFVLTGFDNTRAGTNYGFESGALFSSARSFLAADFPNATLGSVSALSAASLAGTDVLFLAALQLTTQLSAAEQTALFNFVAGGGGLILLLENVNWDVVSESLIDAFGMDSDGVIVGSTTATVSGVHPVTDGPFGVVASFTQVGPGHLSALGPYAASHATNALGVALGIIAPGALGAGSGGVIIFSDTNQFDNTYFAGNETLFLNSIAYAQSGQASSSPVPEPGTLVLLGAALAACGIRRRLRYRDY